MNVPTHKRYVLWPSSNIRNLQSMWLRILIKAYESKCELQQKRVFKRYLFTFYWFLIFDCINILWIFYYLEFVNKPIDIHFSQFSGLPVSILQEDWVTLLMMLCRKPMTLKVAAGNFYFIKIKGNGWSFECKTIMMTIRVDCN